jgi:tetratricopeptide (TPR) repeat protein
MSACLADDLNDRAEQLRQSLPDLQIAVAEAAERGDDDTAWNLMNLAQAQLDLLQLEPFDQQRQNQRIQQAIEAAGLAVKHSTEYPSLARRLLGNAWEAQAGFCGYLDRTKTTAQQYAPAIEAYTSNLQVFPGRRTSEARFDLGRIQYSWYGRQRRPGTLQEAKQHLENVAGEEFLVATEAKRMLGELALASSPPDFDGAQRWFRAARLATSPGTTEYNMACWGLAQATFHRARLAKQARKKAADEAGKQLSDEALKQLAEEMHHAAEEMRKQAVVLRVSPRPPMSFFNPRRQAACIEAAALELEGKTNEALDGLNEALKLRGGQQFDASHVTLLTARANLHYIRQELGPAIADAEAVTRITPYSWVLAEWLGKLAEMEFSVSDAAGTDSEKAKSLRKSCLAHLERCIELTPVLANGEFPLAGDYDPRIARCAWIKVAAIGHRHESDPVKRKQTCDLLWARLSEAEKNVPPEVLSELREFLDKVCPRRPSST